MAIPSVRQGSVEFAGKVFEIGSPRGLTWLESVISFRYEPAGVNKPYTVRKELGKGGDYWYGYRKMAGRLHKKYIGKSSELSTAKLEEIAEALNTPPQPRVTDKVTEVTEGSERVVTEQVTDRVTVERFTALELKVQALQESLEALRSELPGKSDAGNREELPVVTDTGLQTELGNLKAENESLRQELRSKVRQIEERDAELLKLHERNGDLGLEVQNLTEQLETERADREEVEAKLTDREEQMRQLLSQLVDLKQKSAPGVEFPEAGDLLNQLKAKRKKSKTDLADIEEILAMIEG